LQFDSDECENARTVVTVRPGSGDDTRDSVNLVGTAIVLSRDERMLDGGLNPAQGGVFGLLRRLFILQGFELLEKTIHFLLEILEPLVIFALRVAHRAWHGPIARLRSSGTERCWARRRSRRDRRSW
jgi:hypothetical protein